MNRAVTAGPFVSAFPTLAIWIASQRWQGVSHIVAILSTTSKVLATETGSTAPSGSLCAKAFAEFSLTRPFAIVGL